MTCFVHARHEASFADAGEPHRRSAALSSHYAGRVPHSAYRNDIRIGRCFNIRTGPNRFAALTAAPPSRHHALCTGACETVIAEALRLCLRSIIGVVDLRRLRSEDCVDIDVDAILVKLFRHLPSSPPGRVVSLTRGRAHDVLRARTP